MHLAFSSTRSGNPLHVDFFSVHFSIFDRDQCSLAVQLTNFIAQQTAKRQGQASTVILAGDFNSYFDFEYPIEYLMMGPVLPKEMDPCAQFYGRFSNGIIPPSPTLRDVMLERWGNQVQLLHTFTNFDTIGNLRSEDKSRPDHIFYRSHSGPDGVELDCALLFGDEYIRNIQFPDGSAVFPSDHLGIFASFKRS